MSEEKTQIKPDTEKMTKSRGSTGQATYHCGDDVAGTLAGMTIDEVKEIATQLLDEETANKYNHLNTGQQRMNLGNRIRGFISKTDRANEKALAAAEKDGKKAPKVKSGSDQFYKVAGPIAKVAAKRLAAAEKEREQAAKERAKKAAQKKADDEAKAAAKTAA